MQTGKSFDYVVIGGGAAGCVVTNRLSAKANAEVLLLEAGDLDDDPRIANVGEAVELWGSDLDWQFDSEEQPGMNGRRILINQGKVLGGGTSVNAMMYVRGNPRNFDMWNALGADGWSYEDVLPYFMKLEDYDGGASQYHSVGGPLSVRDCPDDAVRSEAFMLAATELGYAGPHWDVNGAQQENGAGLLQFNIDRHGKRASAATAFVRPVLDRPNLTVETGAEATRILFDGTRVIGVEYIRNGQTQQVNVGREVILSAGAFLSPKLLMLSGIGPADHLRAHGIDVVAELPGVGQNLQDHVQLPVVYRSRVEAPMPSVLTGNVLFVRTRPGMSAAPPDLQLNFTPAVPEPLSPVMDFGGPACVFLPILVQPYSRGEVKLRSTHWQDPPLINPNYLQCETDVQVLANAVQLIRELANTKAFAELNGGEIAPGDGDVEQYIRSQSSTLWHPAGTCKIGYDAQAVADPRLRVYGVEGLRVGDASVMPTITSGNTAAACFMIGEKMADLILEDN
jgi:choline dehydrogenase